MVMVYVIYYAMSVVYNYEYTLICLIMIKQFDGYVDLLQNITKVVVNWWNVDLKTDDRGKLRRKKVVQWHGVQIIVREAWMTQAFARLFVPLASRPDPIIFVILFCIVHKLSQQGSIDPNATF